MKRFVVCYDMSSNSSRLKVMKKLRNMGFHAQLSFFELNAKDREEVVSSVKAHLQASDRFAVVRLNKKAPIKRIGSLFEGTEWVL